MDSGAVAGDQEIVRAVEAFPLIGLGEHRLLTRGEVHPGECSSSAVGDQQSTTAQRQAVRAGLAERAESGSLGSLTGPGTRWSACHPSCRWRCRARPEEQISPLAAHPHGTFSPDVARRDDVDSAFQWIGDAGKRHGRRRRRLRRDRRAPHTSGTKDQRTSRRAQERPSICLHPSTSQRMSASIRMDRQSTFVDVRLPLSWCVLPASCVTTVASARGLLRLPQRSPSSPRPGPQLRASAHRAASSGSSRLDRLRPSSRRLALTLSAGPEESSVSPRIWPSGWSGESTMVSSSTFSSQRRHRLTSSSRPGNHSGNAHRSRPLRHRRCRPRRCAQAGRQLRGGVQACVARCTIRRLFKGGPERRVKSPACSSGLESPRPFNRR